MRNRLSKQGLVSVLIALAAATSVHAEELVTAVPAFPKLRFDRPTDLQHAPNDPGHLYLVEQAGRILVFETKRDVEKTTVLLDIRDRVLSEHREEGLLGLAFHPQYKQNGYFYVNYTAANPRRTVIARFTRTKPRQADPNSEQIVLSFPQPYGNHNGGQLAFGPDGSLYIATGDGGSGGDPYRHAQNRKTLLGKILRIDVSSESKQPYRIPADNPFANNDKGYRQEIFAYGLRNPWRFSFDTATGRLWVADVGQDRIEEIDLIQKGHNYGWNIMEGTLCFNPRQGCKKKGLTLPISEYSHDLGASIIGGYVYRGRAVPALVGQYLYTDFVSRRLWALPYNPKEKLVPTQIALLPEAMTTFGIDDKNELYLCAYSGAIYRLRLTKSGERMRVQ